MYYIDSIVLVMQGEMFTQVAIAMVKTHGWLKARPDYNDMIYELVCFTSVYTNPRTTNQT